MEKEKLNNMECQITYPMNDRDQIMFLLRWIDKEGQEHKMSSVMLTFGKKPKNITIPIEIMEKFEELILKGYCVMVDPFRI
jgi:hypothetical protein